MMICPESYAEMQLTGKTKDEILGEILNIQKEIRSLKHIMEAPNYVYSIYPSEDTRISWNRDYLKLAIKAYENLGGEYKLSDEDIKAKAFDKNIGCIKKLKFSIVSWPMDYIDYIVEIKGNKVYRQIQESGIHSPDKGMEFFMPKRDFIDMVSDMFIGEWNAEYTPETYDVVITDGENWSLDIEYSNDSEPFHCEGYNIYPWNFEDFIDFIDYTGANRVRKFIKDAIIKEVKYIDNMNFGEGSTTSRILRDLGYGKMSHEDLMDIEFGVIKRVKKTRDYILDKSHHEGKEEGVPYNLDFFKAKKYD